MKYANDKKAPYVVMIGGTEMEKGVLSVKNMESGEQREMSLEALMDFIS